MQLVPVGLRGRRFLIQYYAILAEFGKEIPWLDGMDDLRFATNGEWFRAELMQRTQQLDAPITPYQFVDADAPRSFLGGILHFPRSPERLRDHRNITLAKQLEADGSSFISCLQVQNPVRGRGIGNTMMKRALGTLLRTKGPVWGVVSNPRLLPWYRSIGGHTPSPANNRDRLWIVHWDTTP